MKKIFLTVLGTSDYKECYYYHNENEIRCKFIQEALIKLLFKSTDNLDVKVILTDKALNENYYPNNNTESLKEVFDRLNINAELIIIPEGKSSNELWDIFDKTSKLVENYEEETEVILDITHSLRNIPIQVMVALNYAKLFNNINLSGIYYGAFEVGEFRDDPLNKNSKIKYAPICNLNVYNELLNWTNAINSFDKTGNANEITTLYNQKKAYTYKYCSKDEQDNLTPLTNIITSLNDFTQCINTCRGDLLDDPSVHKYKLKSIGSAAHKLFESINSLDDNSTILPLVPLFSIVKEKIKPFINKNNFEIGLATVNWCIDHSLYQQGYTALDETIKTFICDKLNLHQNPNDIKEIKKHREYIASTALNCISIDESDWIFDKSLNDEEKKCLTETIYILRKNKELKKLASSLKEKRNDINHFGFRGNLASPYNNLSCDLKKYYETFLKIKDTIDLSNVHF